MRQALILNADLNNAKRHALQARSRAFASLRWSMPEYNEVYVDAVNLGHIPRLMRPRDAYKLHLLSRRYLELKLARSIDGRTVVVTHHAPHPNSISDQFRSHPSILLSFQIFRELSSCTGQIYGSMVTRIPRLITGLGGPRSSATHVVGRHTQTRSSIAKRSSR